MTNTFVLFNGYDSSDFHNFWVTNGTAAGTSELSEAELKQQRQAEKKARRRAILARKPRGRGR